MRVFISYPRELQESAKKIEAQLQHRKFDTFLDTEQINPSQAWQLVIENEIKKASVFVILYDSGAAADKTRYFSVEIDHIIGHIKEQLEASQKQIIPVIFHPTTPEDLPHFLEDLQAIKATTNGLTDKGKDLHWIYKVIKEAERLRNIQNERRKQRLTVSLLIAAILILAGIIIFLLSVPRSPDPTLSTAEPKPLEPVPATTSNDPWADSKRTCEELRGIYNLLGSYVYIEEPDIKATSVHGSWEAKNCKRIEKPEGTFILEGGEVTTHQVEIKINNTYVHVEATNKSLSVLTINKGGGLAERRIFFPVDGEHDGIPKIKRPNTTDRFWKEHRNHIERKLEIYERLVLDKHIKAEKDMRCIPTRGKNRDNQEVIASICSHSPNDSSNNYTRVMVKHH